MVQRTKGIIDLTDTVSDQDLEEVTEQRGLGASGSASSPIDLSGQ